MRDKVKLRQWLLDYEPKFECESTTMYGENTNAVIVHADTTVMDMNIRAKVKLVPHGVRPLDYFSHADISSGQTGQITESDLFDSVCFKADGDDRCFSVQLECLELI